MDAQRGRLFSARRMRPSGRKGGCQDGQNYNNRLFGGPEGGANSGGHEWRRRPASIWSCCGCKTMYFFNSYYRSANSDLRDGGFDVQKLGAVPSDPILGGANLIVNLVFLTSLILMFENSDRAVRLCPVKC